MVTRLAVTPSCETCHQQRCRSCQSPVQRTCCGRGKFRDGCAIWSSNYPCQRQPHFEHLSAQQSPVSGASKTLFRHRWRIAPALCHLLSLPWKIDVQTAVDSALSLRTFQANLSALNSWWSPADKLRSSHTTRIVFVVVIVAMSTSTTKMAANRRVYMTTCSRKISRDLETWNTNRR